MKLRDIAHARSGDKGNMINISVIPYEESDYNFLKEKLSEKRVKEFFKDMCKGKVIRYEVDSLSILNFVLENSLEGGSCGTLGIDALGRSTGQAILDMDL